MRNLFQQSAMTILLMFVAGECLAQDTAVVVVLSSRVGPVIRKADREYFGLFRIVADYDSAFFVNTDDEEFFAFIYRSKRADTMMHFNATLVNMLSEKIEHYESIKQGKYLPRGSRSIPLEKMELSESQRADWNRVRPDQSIVGTRRAKDAPQAQVKPPPRVQKPPRETVGEGGRISPDDKERKGTTEIVLKQRPPGFHYPDSLLVRTSPPEYAEPFQYLFGFGIGISSFSAADLSGIPPLFASAESRYRSQGYSIPKLADDVSLGALFWYSIRFNLFSHFSILGEVGFAMGADSYQSISGMLLFEPPLIHDSNIKGSFGTGIGHAVLNVRRDYDNARISQTSSSGSYEYLDYIDFRVESFAWIVRAGLALEFSGVNLSAWGRMTIIPDQTTRTQGSETKISLGNTQLGLSLLFYVL